MNSKLKQPLVSVLMTVYNREKYIGEAIDSIIASTYDHWELIIVDDSSIDGSVAIAKSYAEKDKRINVYVNDKNLGDYPNRNQAASYAKGKYLKYVDADDMIYPHGLELLVYYMEQFPESGYGLCSLPQDKFRKFPFQLNPKEAYQRHYFEQALFHKAPLSAIINRQIFNERGGFTGKRMLGDFEMWNLLSQTHSVVLMPHGIAWYREHDEQEMADHRTDPMHPFKYILLAEDLLKSPSCPLEDREKVQALKNNKIQQANAILSAFKHHGKGKAMELSRASGISLYKAINLKFIK
ncbi:glycosyltransferase family 2 protein [Subsaximicrobium wynnwilliamsii]|uniref:Glycosyltransferase family 2 protein n=1 Tax=Subsaximicrobium wynnwilliamsii TaxID=291179 RepID=A0A5C6ZJ37_9FLAO|nr:glycosyltransferase family 2 protein [Subsaximicrobium wynnwilliamsii]TXD81361.1 glycosyltransferase family 2 protein [Subsaximicrobium wynnwilliamsii]TXD89057.1 glycosyltransferase family 2 protein [Subsaximicrobium wynnwilliamsii]TXE00735.1 glycosyltransferase family 2 protein [Subsaximicrobium wynnwilliamsii]